jgi:hypothetical protein
VLPLKKVRSLSQLPLLLSLELMTHRSFVEVDSKVDSAEKGVARRST